MVNRVIFFAVRSSWLRHLRHHASSVFTTAIAEPLIMEQLYSKIGHQGLFPLSL